MNLTFFKNRLEFLKTHRGHLTIQNDSVLVDGNRPELTHLIQLGEFIEVPAKKIPVHIHSENASNRSLLEQHRYRLAESITYMSIRTDLDLANVNASVQVRTVTNINDIELFSEIQARGFLPTQEIYDSWKPTLAAANLSNFQNPNQIFYTGGVGGNDAGVALAVYADETVGLYAVATLPKHRKMGISTAIINRVIADAKKRGFTILELQAESGSYAEAYYKKLGFQVDSVMNVFRQD